MNKILDGLALFILGILCLMAWVLIMFILFKIFKMNFIVGLVIIFMALVPWAIHRVDKRNLF